jgi:L-fuconolactonase
MIFVEADRRRSESLAEVEWVLSVPSSERPVAGVVASASLELSSADDELDALQVHPQVRGIRRLLQDARPGFCLEPEFIVGVRSLAQRGLVFDLCVRHHQLAEATALVERCPEVTFVLDHLGKPRVRPFPDRTWLLDIQRLAAHPNTRCKLSGLTSEVLDPLGSTARTGVCQPYLEHALQTFGPARCMFGSDWPVASLTVTYEGWFDCVTDALTGFSANETGQVLSQTAAEVYGLARPEGSDGSSGHDDATVPSRPDRRGGVESAWH